MELLPPSTRATINRAYRANEPGIVTLPSVAQKKSALEGEMSPLMLRDFLSFSFSLSLHYRRRTEKIFAIKSSKARSRSRDDHLLPSRGREGGKQTSVNSTRGKKPLSFSDKEGRGGVPGFVSCCVNRRRNPTSKVRNSRRKPAESKPLSSRARGRRRNESLVVRLFLSAVRAANEWPPLL